MSAITKMLLRFAPLKSASTPLRQSLSLASRPITRSLWYMCSKENSPLNSHFRYIEPLKLCSCGCGGRGMHTKAERELVEFLSQEIVTESKNQKVKALPTEVEGFKVKTEGADVILTKTTGNESIEIHFNVNHTVTSDGEAEIDPEMDKPNFGELKSRPQFDVDLKRGTQTLSFSCSFFETPEQEPREDYNDLFGIDEVALYDGEWKENNFAVSGEILDGCLYDLLMNLLDEKGINNEFVEKLSDFSTAYENHLYINMLQSIQKFTTGN